MLQQCARHSQRHLKRCISAIPSANCIVCTCQCGAQFRRNDDQRQYATKRRAPSTWRKQQRRDPITNTPEQAKWRRTLVKEEQQALYKLLAWRHRIGASYINGDDAIDFLNDFDGMVKKYRSRPTVDPGEFKRIRDQYHVSEADAMNIAKLLLKERDDDNRFRGKKLILSLSRAGYAEASIFVISQAVLQAKEKPEVLKSSEIAYSRAHLTEVANKSLDYRAMVLEGKVAHAIGEPNRAISLWTGAVKGALAAADEREAMRKAGKRLPAQSHTVDRDMLELSSPWIELMLIHHQRSLRGDQDEMGKCRWAMEIGCKQDDPTSHYYAATFTKKVNDQGNHVATSTWLYHILKAASSGHQKACHELGVYYAQSGWKYIEDEPPEHIKPTPFDSYPAQFSTARIWPKIVELLGMRDTPKTDPREAHFHSATYPSTATERFKLAFAWLDIAMHYNYAPSYLFKARMYMQERLWAGANAPQFALQLSSTRYTSTSKADQDQDKLIDQPATEEAADLPNPFCDVEKARNSLREVFNAYEAKKHVESARQRHAAGRLRGTGATTTDEDDILSAHNMSLPPRLQKWFRYPVVREMYENELENLYAEAKGICDEQGWDMYDDEGGLLYKAKRMNRERIRGNNVVATAVG